MKYIEVDIKHNDNHQLEHYEPRYPGTNLLDDYLSFGKLSIYKNLFDNDVTIYIQKTIDDINTFLYKKIKYIYDNNVLTISNQYIDDYLESLFLFYG